MAAAEETERKAIPLDQSNPALGLDDLNLCEFPLAACGHRTNPDQKSLSFEDEIFDEGNQQLVQRKLIVSASDAFGLPTPVDSDVLLVLMHLTNCRNRFQSETVPFTRYELVKFLGWDEGGKSYRRLEESLLRWSSVTLFYNRAWWDRDRRRWRSQTFHVLESLDLRGREGASGPSDDGQSSFTWNKVLFSSFQSNHIKRLDLGTYFRLQIPAARQAYRFLDKRFYRAQRFEMDLRLFACEHVGFARSYDNAQLKRKLQPALDELEAIGFLSPVPASQRFVRRRHGEWQIVLHRSSKASVPVIAVDATDSLLVSLTERGLRPTIAAGLIKQFPAERISEKIELHDWLVERKDQRISQNPAGYLTAAIRDDYALPKGFLTKAARLDHERKQAAKKQTEVAVNEQSQQQSQSRQAALAFLERLTPEERSGIEAEAIECGSPDLVAKFRSIDKPNLAAMLLKELVIAYVQKSGLLQIQAA